MHVWNNTLLLVKMVMKRNIENSEAYGKTPSPKNHLDLNKVSF